MRVSMVRFSIGKRALDTRTSEIFIEEAAGNIKMSEMHHYGEIQPFDSSPPAAHVVVAIIIIIFHNKNHIV